MNKIFLWCVPTGTGTGYVRDSTPGGDVIGYALAEDGTGLASHLSSNKDFSKHDMGLSSDWKRNKYKEHYPDGFELEWVDDTDSHPEFLKAFALYEQKQSKQGEPVPAEVTG